LPEGHLPLTRIIVVPMIENGRIVAVCMLGNKRSNYTDADSRQLSLLVNGLWRIIARKRAEDEVMAAKQQAELYLDLMGHDISNMHQIVMGQLELARETLDETGSLSAGDRELIDTSLETLGRSAKLIDNVRKLQKLRSGELKAEVIDLDDLLSNIVGEFEPLVPAGSIILTVHGSHRVMANILLHDVFSNLAGNAIKHFAGGNIKINIMLETADVTGANYCRVSIEDNGPGVPDLMKDKIFNRLQRGVTKARGMGLGLYLVKALIESYDGMIWVEDRVKGDHTKGARFVVMLPAVEK